MTRLLKRFAWWNRQRLEGVEAVSWENGYFTKDRTDLPFPPVRPPQRPPLVLVR